MVAGPLACWGDTARAFYTELLARRKPTPSTMALRLILLATFSLPAWAFDNTRFDNVSPILLCFVMLY